MVYTMKNLPILILAIFMCYSTLQSQTSKLKSDFKLRVSKNGRFLEYESGRPFFWLGDTGWLLFSKLNREDAEKYLNNRKANGYNVIQVMTIHGFPSVNVYGDSAFVSSDPAKPKVTPGNNPNDKIEYDFWDHVDYIIDKAAEKGIYIAMVPVWGSNVKNRTINMGNAAIYASWLANRYKNKPNIIWINGGDINGGDNLAVWNEIGKTLRANDPNHLITFHPIGRTQSSTWFHNEPWLDFNMFQSGHRRYSQDTTGHGEDNWKYVESDYKKVPVKPVIDGEPSYEGIPQGLHDPKEPFWSNNDVRRYAYWSVFAGSFGHTYGNNAVMQMHKTTDKGGAYGVKDFWTDAINAPGAKQMVYIKNLILSRPFFERVPDQTIITGDNGKKYDYIIVTRGNSYLFAYTYNGQNIKINLGKISGTKIKAYWYNPRSGNSTVIGIFDNKGIKEFNPPGNKEDGNDWVLVIDDKAKNYSVPGKTSLK
jgi:hypothetical protein